jgi:hypothetical protein
LRDRLLPERHWMVVPQNEMLCADDGTLLVDYVGKYEELQKGFDEVCERLGIPKTTLPHVNPSTAMRQEFELRPRELVRYFVHRVRGGGLPWYDRYEEYYDDETKAIVGDLYRKGIEMFGYSFGDQ